VTVILLIGWEACLMTLVGNVLNPVGWASITFFCGLGHLAEAFELGILIDPLLDSADTLVTEDSVTALGEKVSRVEIGPLFGISNTEIKDEANLADDVFLVEMPSKGSISTRDTFSPKAITESSVTRVSSESSKGEITQSLNVYSLDFREAPI